MHPLDGPRFKVARANAEIDRLGSMQDIFFENTHHNIVRAEQNPISGKDIYRVKIDGPPPSLDWGVYIGEIAHNLRSALNHIVYQLALLNSSNEPETVAGHKRLQFPIFLCRREFKAKGKNMIKLLRPEHQTRIEGLQPYSSSGSNLLKTIDLTKWSGRNSPLFWLEEINNADKHRIIQVAGVRPVGIGYAYWGNRLDPFTPKGFVILEDGAEFGEGATDVDMNINMRLLVAFSNGCDAVFEKPVVLAFTNIATHVSEIIDSFSPDFPR